MPKKLEVFFRVEYNVENETNQFVAAFVKSQAPSLKITSIKIEKKSKGITAIVDSDLPALISNGPLSELNPKALSTTLSDGDDAIEGRGHALINDVVKDLTMQCLQAKEVIIKYEELKGDYERLQNVVKEFSKEIQAIRSLDPKEERKDKHVLDEIKDYVAELLEVYTIVKGIAKKRLEQLRSKEVSANNYKSMIAKIKDDSNKGSQLKMLNEMKKRTPFMTAIALREDNIRVALLGVTAVANVKYNKLQTYAEEIEQCNHLVKLAEDKCFTYKQRNYVYNPTKEISLQE